MDVIEVHPDREHHIKRFSLAIFILIGIGLSLMLVYMFLEVPRFVKLEIEPPLTTIGRGTWHNTQFTVLKWDDSRNKYFIWRTESRASSSVYESWSAIADYYNSQLVDHGWVKHPSAFSLCRSLSESLFLPQGENGYVAYLRNGDDPTKLSPVTCLAIWPYSYAGSSRGYNVVIEVSNPSPLAKLWDSFE